MIASQILTPFAVLFPALYALVWIDAKVGADLQARVGPSRTGAAGWLQPAADMLRLATARAISEADRSSGVAVIAVSGCEDTGRLGFVRQREFIDQPRQPQ